MAGINKIITSNKELYTKLNQLHLVNEIIINNTPRLRFEQIIKKINGNQRVLSYEKLGNYILIKKHMPMNFSIYHSKIKNSKLL